jgi:kynureninase
MQYEKSREFARQMDRQDPLREFRKRFYVPRVNGKPSIYFAGNSLGLQPRKIKEYLLEELDDWAKLGVEGHVHGTRPWIGYHKQTKKALSVITGAKRGEVVAMNHLTVNLHLLLVSFYRPTRKRFRILTEQGAFPSDQYVIESQLRFHGFDPKGALVELKPREGEFCLRTEDILEAMEYHRESLALVFLGAVHYYTGQFFDLKRITEAGHRAGAVVGFDLAHAIGNVILNLHTDDVDFAAWCSYKYLNSGPGAIAGIFVHERHGNNPGLPRFSGWWGHDEKVRFEMKKGFSAMPGADGWQLSNHPILLSAAHLAALEVTVEAGMKNLRRKSEQLTGYLEFLLNTIDPQKDVIQLLTPPDKNERGCQLSLYMKSGGKKVFQRLIKSGVIADWREPNVIRLAPVPLYNTFEEVFRVSEVIEKALRP